MPDCREVTRRLSLAQDEPLPLGQRVGTRLHCLMCPACTRFGQQLTVLRQMTRAYARGQGEARAAGEEAPRES